MKELWSSRSSIPRSESCAVSKCKREVEWVKKQQDGRLLFFCCVHIIRPFNRIRKRKPNGEYVYLTTQELEDEGFDD
jgi:hypothetical protein